MALVPSLFSQDLWAVLKKHDSAIVDKMNKPNKLVVISSSNCGYCKIALESIQQVKYDLDIIIVEYGTKTELKSLQAKYSYVFFDGNKVDGLETQNFFPKLYLYNSKDKLIWKRAGWFEKNIDKIKSNIQPIY